MHGIHKVVAKDKLPVNHASFSGSGSYVLMYTYFVWKCPNLIQGDAMDGTISLVLIHIIFYAFILFSPHTNRYVTNMSNELHDVSVAFSGWNMDSQLLLQSGF